MACMPILPDLVALHNLERAVCDSVMNRSITAAGARSAGDGCKCGSASPAHTRVAIWTFMLFLVDAVYKQALAKHKILSNLIFEV